MPSLRALAQVDHYWNTVTSPFIYETLSIHFTDHNSLQHNVAAILDAEGPGRTYLAHATRVEHIAIPASIDGILIGYGAVFVRTHDLQNSLILIQLSVPHSAESIGKTGCIIGICQK
ncbi:hypothetical protein BBP40_011828 [Aspergillus hancockii]|nr:hypothetical protein BBP40_011828 [Aspergillus hancockii]